MDTVGSMDGKEFQSLGMRLKNECLDLLLLACRCLSLKVEPDLVLLSLNEIYSWMLK